MWCGKESGRNTLFLVGGKRSRMNKGKGASFSFPLILPFVAKPQVVCYLMPCLSSGQRGERRRGEENTQWVSSLAMGAEKSSPELCVNCKITEVDNRASFKFDIIVHKAPEGCYARHEYKSGSTRFCRPSVEDWPLGAEKRGLCCFGKAGPKCQI